MEIRRLVKMANDIGSFFESDTDQTRGAAGVANHIRMFWDPRMRRELLAYVDEKGGAGLNPIVVEAIRQHSQDLNPVN
jgi:formate dehydrogenase subunit delta